MATSTDPTPMAPIAPRDLVEHAERELDRVGMGDPDADFGGAIKPHVLDVVRAFSRGGHSGGSAALTIALLEKLLRYEPLAPLTGEPDEWVDVSHVGGGIAAQNVRCSRVIRYTDGSVVDVEGRMVRDADGDLMPQAAPVTFPYMPRTEIVEREL